MLKRLAGWCVVACVNLALIEVGFYLLIQSGLINTTFPTYKIQKRRFFGDYDQTFGAWHIPNSEFRHKTQCFDKLYSFNEVGAKDSSFRHLSDRIQFS